MTHSTTDVWTKLDSQGKQIVELGANQVATDARLAGLEQSVQHGFDAVNSTLTRMSDKLNREPPKPNWIGIGMLILGAMAMFGTYSYLMVNPLHVMIAQSKEEIRQLEDELADHQKSSLRLAEILGEIRNNTDRNTLLITEVDRYGSRRWNRESPSDRE